MPNINIDDAYMLGETGEQVDKVTGLFTKDEGTTNGEKAFAQLNIGTAGSNRNLLDNWYFVGGGSQLGDGIFPINQRGQSTYTGGGTQLDRWKTWDGSDTIVLTANGLQYTSPNSNGLFQYFPVDLPTNTMTFSVKVSGTIYSVTIAEGTSEARTNIPGGEILVNRPNKTAGIISHNTTLLLQAAKLEVGTVSTLANDAPPDFGEELRKCQRYFVRFAPKINSRAYIGTGSANNSNNMLIFVPTPATLRATPTVSFSMCNCYNWVVGGSIGINAINLDSWSDNWVFVSCVPADTSQAPQGEPYALKVASGGFFDLSCEL